MQRIRIAHPNGHRPGDGALVKLDPDGRPHDAGLGRVLVIGGAGYVGSRLVHDLLARGKSVRVMDAFVYGDEGVGDLYGDRRFSVVHGDLRDRGAVRAALRNVDAVVHLGGLVGDPACRLDEHLTLEINLASTKMIGQEARASRIGRFVFASTCSVYGGADHVVTEESVPAPVSVYARSKLYSERLLQALHNDGFAPVILRFGTLFGLAPRPRFDLVVNLLAARATSEGRVTILGGSQWRPFLHVSDAAAAIVTALEAPTDAVAGQIFNAGADEHNHPIAHLGTLIERLVPDAHVVYELEEVDPADYHVSFTKISKRLGFRALRTLEEGILEVRDAIVAGEIADYTDPRYNNEKALGAEVDVLREGLPEAGAAKRI